MKYTEARQIIMEAATHLINEGAYVPKEREARWMRKRSRKLLRMAIARGDKYGADKWRQNIRDAEEHIKEQASSMTWARAGHIKPSTDPKFKRVKPDVKPTPAQTTAAAKYKPLR